MNSSAGVSEWATKLKSAKDMKEERKENEKEAPPVKKAETIKASPPFKVWPKEEPQQELVYQWKCRQPIDNKQKMKLIQAAYACAVNFMPQCTHVLIRSGIHKGTDFDEDGLPDTPDHYHITVSYRNEGLNQKFFETAHCYTASEEYLQVLNFKDAKMMLAYDTTNGSGLRYWPEFKNAVIESHFGRPYTQQVDVSRAKKGDTE